MQVSAGHAGDKDWLLYAARQWLQGLRLDVEVVEVNPPLVVWAYAIPVWVSLHVPFISDSGALALLGLLACALCSGLAGRLIGFHPGFAEQKDMRWKPALFLMLLFVFFTSPTYFFDRDHIFWVLTFPYMLRYLPGLARQMIPFRLRLTVGMLAAAGFCIKPHTFIFFAFLQLLYVLRERSAAILGSVENRIIYACALLYLACVYVFVPEYIQVIMPMAAATYMAFGRRILGIFYGVMALIIAGVSFADFRPRDHSPYRRDILYLIGVNTGFLLYALAGNGWGYTYHPLIGTLLFTTGLLWLEYDWFAQKYAAQGLPVQPFVFGRRACFINLLVNAAYMLFCMAVFFAAAPCDRFTECVKNRPYVQYIEEHAIRSFGALSEDFHKWPSLSRLSGATFATRYNALWMVPQLALEQRSRAGIPPGHRWIIDKVGRGLADDLMRRKPEIVFADTSPRFFGYDFSLDLPGFFSDVPAFREAWSHYRYVASIDRCISGRHSDAPVLSGCRYAIYQRRGQD